MYYIGITSISWPFEHLLAVEYSLKDKRISGDLYHRVATYSVMVDMLVGSLLPEDARSFSVVLANPKSHIFTMQFSLIKMLLGFKSLWTMPDEWMYLSPLTTWYKMNETWSFDSFWLELMIFCRSVSISSQVKYRSSKVPYMLGWRNSLYPKI